MQNLIRSSSKHFQEPFPIHSDDCYLLLLLENFGSIKDVAQALNRDISVVSRQISRLGQDTGLVEKINGKWIISSIGRKFNHCTKDAIQLQKQILYNKVELKIATTREFASRILAPNLTHFIQNHLGLEIHLISTEDGTEQLLLDGKADLGIDCGRPKAPNIRFKRTIEEKLLIVSSAQFCNQWKIKSLESLLSSPHLQLTRVCTTERLQLNENKLYLKAVFNDIGALRAACIAHLGWAILPHYTVNREIQEGKLVTLTGDKIPRLQSEHFGVWWLKERVSMVSWSEYLIQWLAQQTL